MLPLCPDTSRGCPLSLTRAVSGYSLTPAHGFFFLGGGGSATVIMLEHHLGDEQLMAMLQFLKPAVHLHTPNRLIAEFNMGAYEYALSQR